MKRNHDRFFLAVSVSLVTCAVYLPSLWNDFVLWDDDRYVYNNLHIRSLDLAFFKWAFTDVSEHFWQPLTWVFHAMDHAIWGLNPAGHHLSSIVLHALNTALVVFLAIRLLEAAGGTRALSGASTAPNGRSVLIAAGVTGLLFGIHPLQVESVAWVTAKHDLLFTFFFLLSGLTYLKYAAGREAEAVQKAPGAVFLHKQYLLSFVFFILSLSSKPAAVVLPAVLLILDWHPLHRLRSWKDLVWPLIEKLPFVVPGLFVSMATVAVHQAQGGMATLESMPLLSRLLVSAKALVLYLWKTLFPISLVPYYPYPKEISFGSFEYLFAVLLLIVITGACIMMMKKRPAVLAVLLFSLVTLFPVLGIFKVRDVFMADRYMYLPLVGLALLSGGAAGSVWERVESTRNKRWMARTITGLSAAAICAVLAYATVHQVPVWRNTIALWTYVIEKEPERVLSAHINRGWAYKEQGMFDLAMEDFTTAIAIDSASAYLAYNNRGVLLKELGQIEAALEDFNSAIALEPTHYLAYGNRGLLFVVMGQYDRAERDFTATISFNPSYADAFISRAVLYQETGRIDLSLADLDRAILLNPYSVDAYLNRGVVLAKLGEFDRALSDYDKANSLNGSDYLVYFNRGILHERMDRAREAIEDYTAALSSAPDSADIHVKRGDLYLRTGQKELAEADYRTACQMQSQAGCRSLRLFLKQ
ncbi:MAG: hypothetical protein A2078_13920 [Nitrospirae bacterium GWC2_57_9]|nr:MAG: hypothetical protein A2078_13920 [Nitrospirae bacterium GWC2_57_9]